MSASPEHEALERVAEILHDVGEVFGPDEAERLSLVLAASGVGPRRLAGLSELVRDDVERPDMARARQLAGVTVALARASSLVWCSHLSGRQRPDQGRAGPSFAVPSARRWWCSDCFAAVDPEALRAVTDSCDLCDGTGARRRVVVGVAVVAVCLLVCAPCFAAAFLDLDDVDAGWPWPEDVDPP